MILLAKHKAAVLVSLLVLALVVWGSTMLFAGKQTDDELARNAVEACVQATSEAEKEICYQKYIPHLMDQGLSMERTFEVVRLVQRLDTGYQSCHVLAHLITAREVSRDPSKWKDVVVRSPMGICGSGAVHGAFQERFRGESLNDLSVEKLGAMLTGVCDPRDGWNPTFLDRSSCMHGMGHLFLYVTNADVRKSVSLCDSLANLPGVDFRQTCFEGVFMQLYQPLEPEDEVLVHALAPLAKDTVKFCAQFSGLVYNTCVKESWPQVSGSTSDPATYEKLCKRTTDRKAQLYCASGLVYPVIETLHYDVPRIESFCSAVVDPEIRSICWARTASKFIWADWQNSAQAVAICNDAPTESKSACWEELVYYAEQGMPKSSPQVSALCSLIPEPWRKTCADRTGITL